MKLRFAARPGTLLHAAPARIALLTWLHARRHSGQVLLRLDDSEPARPELANAVEHDLLWLGLDWDETVRQSGRLDRYAAAADRLRAAGRLYPCFESDEELASKRDRRLRRNQPPVYDRAMLRMTPEQRARAEAGGKRPYWRFLLSGTAIEWDDLVLGRCTVKLPSLSDPVAIAADGTPLPAFAAAVDDAELGTTHLLRGADRLTGSAIHLDLLGALGGRPVRLGHLPEPVALERGKPDRLLLRSLRADGVEPSALAGYLAALGTGTEPVPATPAVLALSFDFARLSRTPPRLDVRRLLELNRQALRQLPFEAVQDRLPQASTPAFWQAVRGELDLLREARGWWDVVAGSIVPPPVEGEGDYLEAALSLLPPEPWDDTTWSGWMSALRTRTGRTGKALIRPLRLALTGEDDGPELRGLLPLMGRPRAMERLRLAAS